MHQHRVSRAPASVLALLAHGAPLFGFVRADTTVDALRQRQSELLESGEAILARAKSEGERDLTVEEKTEVDGLSAEIERIDGQIQTRERLSNQANRLTAPLARQADPDPIDGEAPQADNRPQDRARPAPAASYGSAARQPSAPRASANGDFGFRNFGEFARSVRSAHPGFGGNVDQRLIRNAAPSTYANEGVGADGGFLVPPDFRSEIMTRVFGEESLVERTRRMRSTSNSITVPVDSTTPWGGTGVRSYWTAEGGTKTQSRPTFENVTVKAHTLATLVPVTEELLEDAPALDGYLRMAVPREMNFTISNALIRGDGVGKPLGILNSPGLVTVAAVGGQTTDTINAANVFAMYSRMPVSSRQTAVWLIHPDAESQLFGMTIGQQPVFLPAGGLSDAPYGRLMGRPVIPHQVAATVGDLGDLMFVDFNEYMTLTKTGGGRDANGMRADVSIHLWFDQDMVAYRFTIRLGGQPIWGTDIDPRSGSMSQSPYLVLASR